MALARDDEWLWDGWYAHDGRRWHGFFLKARRALGDPGLRHTHVSIGHAVSDDLVRWDWRGTCFAPAAAPAWDDFTTWTGSVVRGDDRLWHLFYTGTARAEGGLVQRIGHAVSDDLHSWRRQGKGPCLDLLGPAAAAYETRHDPARWHDRAMRDPWVLRDPAGAGWLMFFTARAAGVADTRAAGAIGLATSPDLRRWTLRPPVFVGGWGELEVPQVLAHRGRWYCLFCTFARDFSPEQAAATPGGPVSGTHYLVADDPRGPWSIAPGFLDGAFPSRRYAGRIVETPAGLRLIGFADNGFADLGGQAAFGGTIMDPVPVEADGDGWLRLAP